MPLETTEGAESLSREILDLREGLFPPSTWVIDRFALLHSTFVGEMKELFRVFAAVGATLSFKLGGRSLTKRHEGHFFLPFLQKVTTGIGK